MGKVLLNALMKILKKIFIWMKVTQVIGSISHAMKHAIHAPKEATHMIINAIHVL